MHRFNQIHTSENSVSHNKINSPSQDKTALHPPVHVVFLIGTHRLRFKAHLMYSLLLSSQWANSNLSIRGKEVNMEYHIVILFCVSPQT